MNSFLKFKTLHSKLTLYISAIIIFIAFVICLFISNIFSREIIIQTNNILLNNIDLITKKIDSNIDLSFSFAATLRKNEYIKKLLDSSTQNKNDTNIHALSMSKTLSRFDSNNNFIISIIAIDKYGQILDPVYSTSSYKNIIKDNVDFNYFIKSGRYNLLTKPSSFPMTHDHSMDKSTITFYNTYYDDNYTKIGYLMINLKKNSLFSEINELCSTAFDTIYVVDNENNVIYQVGEKKFDDSVFFNTKKSLVAGNKFVTFSKPLNSYPMWTVVGIVSNAQLNKNVYKLVSSVILISLFFIMLVIVSNYFICKRITYPIHKISESMNSFEEGELPKKLKIQTDDELQILVKGYNKMIEDIKSLIKEVHKEEELKKQMEVAAVQLKLDLLQSQINPHFVHNTLNTISYLAMKQGAYDIKDIIQSFNMLLRASMHVDNKFITINEELSCVTSYLKIQNYRYDNILKFTYDLPKDLEFCKIPRLILQPLVENSIYHGIVPKDCIGTIKITFKRIKDTIKIRVIDDGVGIKKDRIMDVLNNNSENYNRGFNNMSLSNVNDRLKLYFNEDCKINIYSKVGIGTFIQFKIPYIN